MTQRRSTSVLLALALLVVGSASAQAPAPDSSMNALLEAVEQLRKGKVPPAPQNLRLVIGRPAAPAPTPPVAAPPASRGTTYYVVPSGSDSGPCTQARPCRTINGGLARMRSGETLEIGAGTYEEMISTVGADGGGATVPPPSGSSGARTTIKAATPGSVRLRHNPRGSALNFLVYLDGAHDLRLEGVVLDAEQQRQGVRGCISVGGGSRGLQIVNVECLGADNGLAGNGEVEVLGGHYHGMGYPHCYAGEPDGPGYCHGSYLQKDGQPGNWVFDGVLFSGNSGYGVHSYVPGVVVKNSVFRGQFTGGVIIVGPGGTVVNNCFESTNPTPILCQNCVQEGNRVGVPPGGCGSPNGAGGSRASTPPPR